MAHNFPSISFVASLPEGAFSSPVSPRMSAPSLSASSANSPPIGSQLSRDRSSTLFIELPDEHSDDFQNFLTGYPERQPPKYTFPQEERISIPPEAGIAAQHAETYTSFGDDGTTASVNVYGNLMQISRFLGKGKSGFLCVDLPNTPEPSLVQERAQELADLSTNAGSTISGLYMEDSSEVVRAIAGAKPHLEFVRDRWPRFVFDTDAFALDVQYFVRHGTVFQQHAFERKPGQPHVAVVPDVMIDTDVLIRHLDFTDGRSKFNEARNYGSEHYSTSFGPHGYSLVLEHDGLPPPDGPAPALPGAERLGYRAKSESASLVLALFINGVPQKLEEVPNKWYKIQDRNRLEAEFIRTGRVEITMAFRLQVAPENSTWKSSLVPAADLLGMDEEFYATPFRNLVLSPDPRENFALRRNLEHILSVCSIPIHQRKDSALQRDSCSAIALTCGDFSGHRLITAASFYAFQFLLSVHRQLKDFGDETGHHISKVSGCSCKLTHGICDSRGYVLHVLERIRRACKGHLKWIFEAAERADGVFQTHYWASGKPISDSTSTSKLGAKLLTDTPFQIIKAADYAKAYGKEAFPNFQDHAQSLVEPLLKDLDGHDRRKCFMFPRPSSAFTGEYRLDDHVWIWKALRSLEDLGFGADLKPQTIKAATTRRNSHRVGNGLLKEGPARDFSSSEALRHILRRFATENPVSGQRMLAVSRSSGESRFLFFSRDTAMFHDMNASFFDAAETGEKVISWENTIDAQKYHEENQDSGWDNPLRYALALMMGKQGSQINQRPIEDVCSIASNVLLRSSSPSGLFAGQLNEATKEPELVQEKRTLDFYWHATFEIPYILLKYGENRPPLPNHPRLVVHPIEPFAHEARSEAGSFIGPDAGYSRKHGFVMKKTMPFNDLFDHKSIVEPSDEWLYNYPDFLDFDPQLDQYQSFDIDSNFNLYDLLRSISQDSEMWDEIRDLDPGRYKIGRALSELGSETWDLIRNCHERGNGKMFEDDGTKGTVLDVSRCGFKHSHSEHHHDAPGRSIQMMGTDRLKDALNTVRTASSAKKRLVWLPRVGNGSTTLCCLASPNSEKAKMSSFFGRHAKADKYLLDDVTSVLNTWETEFHLSFYQLVDKDKDDKADGMLSLGIDGFPGRGQKIDRTAMGFRFIGDFFDRYWTCHFVERKPGESLTDQELEDRIRDVIFDKRLPKAERDKPLWRQRKVLELLLFDRILEDITASANSLLDAAKTKVQLDLGVRKDSDPALSTADADSLSDALTDSISLFRIDSDVYLSFREEWAMLERILQVLEEDLSENLERIGSWGRREKDRGPEKPRWTKNDERKYRSAITRLEVSNQQRVQELERCQARIRSFSASLTDRLDRVRDDLNLRGAEDIRLFTYITAFFLPLGFAVSIFSMGDPPHWIPVVGTIGVAVVTLFITVVALINARRLELGFKAVINFLKRNGTGDDAGRRARLSSASTLPGSGAKEEKMHSPLTSDEQSEKRSGVGRLLSSYAQRPGIRRARPLRTPQSMV